MSPTLLFNGLSRWKPKPRVTPQQMLAARPVRLVDAEPVPAKGEDSGRVWRVTVPLRPLRPARWAGWLLRVPDRATKTFELDAVGLMVWESCDGKTSVHRIVRKLAKRHGLDLRVAEVSTRQFLLTLTRKGLIGLSVPKLPKAKEA